jgi:flagellar hook-associated protein 3 FlgL
LISSIEDADIASLIVQYQEDQVAYEAALSIGASLIQTSLLDFLR